MKAPEQPKQLPAEPAKEPKLSREQRRWMDRVNKEANQTLVGLQEKFLDFFINSPSPEAPEVFDRMDTMSAQWKLYCARKKLVPQVYNAFQDYCIGVIQEYQETKTPAPAIEA